MLSNIQPAAATALAEFLTSLGGPPEPGTFGGVLTVLAGDLAEPTVSDGVAMHSGSNSKTTAIPQPRAKGKDRMDLVGTTANAASTIPTPQMPLPDFSSTSHGKIEAQDPQSSKSGSSIETVNNPAIEAFATPTFATPTFAVSSSLSQASSGIPALQSPELFSKVQATDTNRQSAPGSNAQPITTGPALAPGDLTDTPPQLPAGDIRKSILDTAERSASATAACSGNVNPDFPPHPNLDSSERRGQGDVRPIDSDAASFAGKDALKEAARELALPISSEKPLVPPSGKLSGIAMTHPLQNPQTSASLHKAENLEEWVSIQPIATVKSGATAEHDQLPSSDNAPVVKTKLVQSGPTIDSNATQDSSIFNHGHPQSFLANRGTPRMKLLPSSDDSHQSAVDSVGLYDTNADQTKSVPDDDRNLRELQDLRSTKNTAAPAVAASSAFDSSASSTQAVVQVQSSANDGSQSAPAHRGLGPAQVDPGIGQADQAPQVHAGHMIRDATDSQMRVDMRTQSFGGIEIHASVSGRQVQLSVAADHGDLRSFLAPEIPLLQDTLKQHDLRLEHVRHSPETGAQSDFSSGSGRQGQDFGRRSATPAADYEPQSPEEPRVDGESGTTLSIRI